MNNDHKDEGLAKVGKMEEKIRGVKDGFRGSKKKNLPILDEPDPDGKTDFSGVSRFYSRTRIRPESYPKPERPPVGDPCEAHESTFDMRDERRPSLTEIEAPSKLLGRVHLRALRTKATTAMLTSSTVPIATPAMMAAKVLSARSTS